MRVPQSSESAEQFQLLDALPVLILLERAGKVVYANAAARQMIGHDDGLWTPRPVDDLLWGLSSGTAEPRTLLKGTQTGSPFHATLTANDGSLLPIEGTYSLLNGDLCDAIIVAHPGGRILAPRSRMMEDVLSSLPEAIVIVHGDRVLYTNPAFTRIFGYTADEAAGADLRALIVPDANAHEHKLLEMALDLDARSPIETVRHNKAGEEVHVAILSSPLLVDGAPVGCILTFRALEAKLHSLAGDAHEALHDPLTGLPNRALFRDRLSLALTRRTRRREQTCGVLLLVLEPMAGAEDAQQQAAGDALLVALAERMRAGLRLQDSAARLDANEFAILVENILDPGDLDIVACRLQREMERPFEMPGVELRPAFSIGAAMATAAHTVPEMLLRDAHQAVYAAQQEGGNCVRIFDRSHDMRFTTEQERERELRTVLEKRQFEFWYQPIYRLQNGRLEAFESLLRRKHPGGSVDSFRDLLSVAENSGLSITLGRVSLDAVCGQLREWSHQREREGKATDLSLTVNLTSRQFFNPDLAAQVKNALAASGMIEVQETTLNENPEIAVAVLERLVEQRVRIAIDNFGAGLAPLNHLMRLPIAVLKLDPRLTAAANGAARRLTVLKSLVRLGHTLGIQVVAQGIETPEQLTALCRMGCELGQGSLLGRPINAADAFALAEAGCWATPPGV